MNRPLILGIIGAVSLVWGVYDLRRKDAAKTPSARAQSWGQIIAGIVALGFCLVNLLR
ncbi:MAG: hypothetical protein JWO30_3980 [Fibrobacteres bacterium]|nr:hypothetical protein [Fibrobacterota bacterium]